MLRAAAISMVLALAPLASYAQRAGMGGSHAVGGEITRPASSFTPHFSSSGNSHYQGTLRPSYTSPTGPAPFGGAYPPGERARGVSYPSRYGYRPNARGVYLYPGYLVSGFWGYGDLGSDYGDNPQPSDNSAAALPAYPPDYYAQAAAPFYPQPPPPAAPAAQQPAASPAPIPDQPATTLVFKDGRPSVQVQSYAITRTTLYILDGQRRREIPLSDLDVQATQQANREAGVDFNLPTGE